MSSARFIIGNALAVLRSLPDDSVDEVLTSPPFLALRSYLPADHPDKAAEVGSEKTPGEFLDVILDVVEECRRVLAPHGSLIFEFGDTYSGSGGAGGDYSDDGLRDGQPKFDGSSARRRRTRPTLPIAPELDAWPEDKSLVGIPALFETALIYGFNPLTGRRTPRWRVRNECPWVRPNPPVGALGDKFRPATSYLTVACTSRDRWFDLDAVRTPHTEPGHATKNRKDKRNAENPNVNWETDGVAHQNPNGAPPLDWFNIPTEPYEGAHYATWPRRLCVPFIKAMCPLRVCRVCGEPSRRITEVTQEVITYGHYSNRDKPGQRSEPKVGDWKGRRPSSEYENEKPSHHQGFVRHAETLGWTDCGHGDGCVASDLGRTRLDPVSGEKVPDPEFGRCADESHWRAGVVLDPFAGSGTTLAVATGHGRDAIGIDIDERNAELALERVGPMFLTVERFADRVEDTEAL